MSDILKPCKFCGAPPEAQDEAWANGIWCCDAANEDAKKQAEARKQSKTLDESGADYFNQYPHGPPEEE